MITVQVATGDRIFASLLRRILMRETGYEVRFVDKPELTLPGVIVATESCLGDLNSVDPTRLIIVVPPGDSAQLTRMWKAGIRNLVYTDDSPQTIFLAVLAARLRLSKAARQANYPILAEGVNCVAENGLLG